MRSQVSSRSYHPLPVPKNTFNKHIFHLEWSHFEIRGYLDEFKILDYLVQHSKQYYREVLLSGFHFNDFIRLLKGENHLIQLDRHNHRKVLP